MEQNFTSVKVLRRWKKYDVPRLTRDPSKFMTSDKLTTSNKSSSFDESGMGKSKKLDLMT